MPIEVLRKEDNLLELKFKGERHTIPNLLAKTLANMKGVEFAAYKLSHPTDPNATLILRTNGAKPEKVLQEAFKEIAKELQEFKSEVNQLK